jgi:hypothetical protein
MNRTRFKSILYVTMACAWSLLCGSRVRAQQDTSAPVQAQHQQKIEGFARGVSGLPGGR